MRHGLYVTLTLGVLTVLAALAIRPFMGIFQQDPQVIAIVPNFLLILAASMIPAMGSMAVKNHSDAMNRPWPVFWISIGAVALNLLLNWMLIFGKLGAPRMGFEGSAVATLIARTASLVGMILWCRHDTALKEWVPIRWLRAPDWAAMRDLLRTGFPASMSVVAAQLVPYVAAGSPEASAPSRRQSRARR